MRSEYPLQPDPKAARTARRAVRRALSDAGLSKWEDASSLAVSELVTNAVLHTRTQILLTVETDRTGATVTVTDTSETMPSLRPWGEAATTGRGLRLVASLVTSYGTRHIPGGKQVWFRVEGDPDNLPTGEPEWDAPEGPALPENRDAVLDGVPVVLWLAAQQHYEAVLRELNLRSPGPGEAALPLAEASRALAAISRAVAAAVDRSAAAATPFLPEGHPSPHEPVPLSVRAGVSVHGSGPAAFAALQDVLDAAQRLSAEGLLLVRPCLPEVVALRDWACEQVVAQSTGVPATKWSGIDHPRFVASAGQCGAPEWDGSEVARSEAMQVAVDDTNRIVACSGPAAEMLGWDPERLVGQRVVVIIPPRLREAHVAGFTRHLTTGQAHALGVEVILPVQRSDGDEVPCRFLIEQVSAGGGRAVYVAVLVPLSDRPDPM